MKITAIRLYTIRLPLRDPFIISYGAYHDMPSIIVIIEIDEGIVGYGESVADDHVTGETWESTFHVLKHTLAPSLIGLNPMNIEEIHDITNQTIYGVPTTKAAIDIACFDVIGKKVNQPVYQLIGGRYHEEFPITHVLSITSPEDMAEEATSILFIHYKKRKKATPKRVSCLLLNLAKPHTPHVQSVCSNTMGCL